MKAILKFDLDDPEDARAHLRCVKALNMAIVLFDLVYNFRKQSDENMDELYRLINEELENAGLNIDELIV